jgi:hypothetical protein
MRPTEAKFRPIPRDRDNTDDLQDAELAVRTRMSKITHPDNAKVRRGAFDPADNTAYNGSTVVAPPT